MSLLIASSITAVVFLAGDFFIIPLVMRPLFKAALGNQMLDTLRLGPAALFYIIHISGLVYFAVLPAIRMGKASLGALNGAIFGLVTYSCYEMTSWTIMRDWNASLVVIDMGWGTLLSGSAAWAGAVAAARAQSSNGAKN